MVDGGGLIGSGGQDVMRWKQFDIDRVGLCEIVIVIVVWIAVVLNEHGFDFERWLVFPFVVDECDEANALNPEPKLSAGLWLILSGDVESNGGDVDVGLKGNKDVLRNVVVGIGKSGAFLMEDLVN